MIPSPADIHYFIEIAQTLNISRAAERLGISQPSLSLAIRRLEDSAGTLLLTRSKRGVSLTQAGKQLLVSAKLLQQSWEGVRDSTRAALQEIGGTYTIGCHVSVGLSLLSRLLPKLMKTHKNLNIALKHDLSRKIAEDVISARVDIGIVVNPVQHPDLVIHPLCRDEVTLWTVKGATPSILICDPDLAQSQALMKQFKKAGLIFDRIITSPNLEMIADLTAAGSGIGILPARVAARAPAKLTRIPSAPVYYDDHCLIYRVENKGVRSIQLLSTEIRALMKT